MFITKHCKSDQYFDSLHPALLIPEIVSHILSFTLPDETNEHGFGDVLQCLQVNNLWHDCAARLLWRNVTFDESSYNSFTKFANTVGEQLEKREETDDDIQTSNTASSLAVANNSIIRQTGLFSNCLDFLFIHTTPPTADKDCDDNSTIVSDDISLLNSSISTNSSTTTITVSLSPNKPISNIPFYRSVVRSITIRKIKKDTINELLSDKIARHCTRLEHIDLYICDHVNNAALSPIIQHGQLTHVSLAGCYQITDACIMQMADRCRQLQHLDLRACGQISDVSISAIAMQCRALKHLNVGRVRDRHRITVKSIRLIALHTKVTVLGLAGCQVDDECMLLLAQYRHRDLERISVNSCHHITNVTIRAYARYCPNLSVFEMKECHLINDWETVVMLAQRKVLMTLCEQQDRACSAWAQQQGVTWDVKSSRSKN
ncbi:hypothetical protein BDA99DRAFT_508261 [Phascolomyces articulosus]|uniref:F-box/LRR-repeat protein 15-like leucin rich repeat domain-containing protein n=1 Tax=Phascolomyces articulosus TaxID=60185 RepID=A0AAD5PE48_9FUNG|nr:hypothetical protein BDA99DRAFT_508261 [Phascolomyces articulosus]